MMRFFLTCFLLSVSIFLIAVEPPPAGWLTNYEAAYQTAREKKKTLLLWFTKSDGSEACKKIRQEEIQTKDFQQYAKQKLILLYLDYPEDPDSMDEALLQQNAELQEVFQVKSFPMILLMDPQEGEEIARFPGTSKLSDKIRKALVPLSPLIKAARADDVDKLKSLFQPENGEKKEDEKPKAKADPNEKDPFGASALENALEHQAWEAACFLMKKGADVNFITTKNQPAFFLAISRTAPENVMKLFIKKGIDVNMRTDDGTTAFLYACRWGGLSTVEFLVGNDAKINVKDKKGMNGLHYAAMSGNERIARYLMERGLTDSFEDNKGRKPSEFAKKEAFKQLLQNGLPQDDKSTLKKKKSRRK